MTTVLKLLAVFLFVVAGLAGGCSLAFAPSGLAGDPYVGSIPLWGLAFAAVALGLGLLLWKKAKGPRP